MIEPRGRFYLLGAMLFYETNSPAAETKFMTYPNAMAFDTARMQEDEEGWAT